MVICCDDERLFDTALELRKTQAMLNDELNRIKKLFKELEGDWQSEAQRALVAKIVYISNYYNGVIGMCDELSKLINNYVKAICEIDSKESLCIEKI